MNDRDRLDKFIDMLTAQELNTNNKKLTKISTVNGDQNDNHCYCTVAVGLN